MPFKDGLFYVFDCANAEHGLVVAVEPSLSAAQAVVNSRLAYDRRADQRLHYEIHERASGAFTLRQTTTS